MGSALMDGYPGRDRFVGSGGIRAYAGLEGVSGHFDASSTLPSNPTKRSSKFHLEMKASRCPGTAPLRSSGTKC